MKRNISIYSALLTILFLFTNCNHNKNSQTISKSEIDSLANNATNLFIEGEIKKSLTKYLVVADKAKKENYNEVLAKTYFSIANCYYELSLADEGSRYLYLAEQIANDEPELMSKINLLKGFILFHSQSYDEAEKKYKITIDYTKKIKDNKNAEMFHDRAYLNIGNINFQLEKYDSALTYFQKTYYSSDMTNKLASCVNMAEIFLIKNKVDSAHKYLQITENNLHLVPYKTLYNKLDEGLKGVKALYYMNLGENFKAIDLLKNNSTETSLYKSEELLGMAYAKIGNNDSASFYFQKNMNNKLNTKKSNLNTYKASSIINNDEKLALIKKQDKERKTYLSFISLSILSIVLLIYTVYNRQKLNKQRTQYLESEKENLRMEKELSELKQEQFQKQVLATSIQLEQKNKVLDELKTNIKNNKDFNLNQYLKNEQFVDRNLSNIHEIIKEVHPKFFKNLNEIAISKLTNHDIKYAAYIYMNMDNTQIASVLNVDPKTVSVTKYRLKQKLGLPKETDLETFIKNM